MAGPGPGDPRRGRRSGHPNTAPGARQVAAHTGGRQAGLEDHAGVSRPGHTPRSGQHGQRDHHETQHHSHDHPLRLSRVIRLCTPMHHTADATTTPERLRRVPDMHRGFPKRRSTEPPAGGRRARHGPTGMCSDPGQRTAVTQPGIASVCSTHEAGGAPALPAAITPPTMAQVVSTSPPTCAVVQNACS